MIKPITIDPNKQEASKGTVTPCGKLSFKKLAEVGKSGSATGCVSLLDAAYEVAHFAKNNEYPEIGSTEFIQFTELIDRLDTELRKFGYKTAT